MAAVASQDRSGCSRAGAWWQSRSRPQAYAIWASLFVVVTLVGLQRQAGLAPWRTIWAEDGSVYYGGTPDLGFVLHGYSGYLQMVPRVLGLAAQPVGVDHLAQYFAVAGGVVTTACAAAVWRFSSQLIPSAVLRAVLALSVWLLPAAVFEQLGNGVNTIWALTFAAWWAILYRPTSRRDAIVPSVIVFFGVASQALAIVYAPVVAYQAWRRRDHMTYVVAGAFAAATMLQLWAITVSSQNRSPAGPSSVGDFPQLYAVRVLGSAFVGEKSVGGLWDAWGMWFAVLAGVAIVCVVMTLVRLAAPGRRALGLLAIGYSVGLWVLAVGGRGSMQLRIPAAGYNSIATRWTTLSIWLLLSGLFILAAGIRSRPARVVATSLLVIQFAVVASLGFREANPRSDAQTWTDSVGAARALCATGDVRRATALVVPPAPGFGIEIDCSEPP